MEKSHTYYSEVSNGKLNKYVQMAIVSCISDYEGKKIKIVIGELKRERSLKQNAFWWSAMIPLIRSWLMEQGIVFDAETTHEFCCTHIWKHTTVTLMPDGTPYEHRLSSTKLNTNQWEEFMEITRAWFAERGLVIPFPEREIPDHIILYENR